MYQNWHRGSPRHMWLGHHFRGQKVKVTGCGVGKSRKCDIPVYLASRVVSCRWTRCASQCEICLHAECIYVNVLRFSSSRDAKLLPWQYWLYSRLIPVTTAGYAAARRALAVSYVRDGDEARTETEGHWTWSIYRVFRRPVRTHMQAATNHWYEQLLCVK